MRETPQFAKLEPYFVRYGHKTCFVHKSAANREKSAYVVLYGLRRVVSRESPQFGIIELYIVQYGQKTYFQHKTAATSRDKGFISFCMF
jgi:hypothetical protein